MGGGEGIGGPRGAMLNQVQPGGPDDPTPYLDRVLQEDVRNDWEVTLCFFVLLDPPAFDPAAAAAAAPGAPAPAPAAAPGH